MDIFGSLIDRPIVHEHFVDKLPMLISSMDRYLDQNKFIYDEQQAEPADDRLPYRRRNMPVVSGTLNWSQELRDRLTGPMTRLRQLNHGALEGAETMIMFSKFEEMMELLAE